MKNIKLSIMALALAGLALLSSCGGDKEAVPTVTIVTPSSTNGEHKVGDKIDFTVSVTGENNLTKIVASALEGSSTTEISSKTDGFTEKKSDDFTFSYEVKGAPGSVITISVEATDKFDNIGTAVYTINIKEELETRTAVIFAGQSNSTGGQFYSVANSLVYNLANAKTNSTVVDLCYAHRSDANGARMITAPSSNNATDIYDADATNPNRISTWGARNATKIRLTTMTAAQFDATVESSKVLTEANTLTTSDLTAATLTVDKVFVFETVGGKKGLGKVEAVTGAGFASTDNSITIKFKIIK
jgi:hypothetical protein